MMAYDYFNSLVESGSAGLIGGDALREAAATQNVGIALAGFDYTHSGRYRDIKDGEFAFTGTGAVMFSCKAWSGSLPEGTQNQLIKPLSSASFTQWPFLFQGARSRQATLPRRSTTTPPLAHGISLFDPQKHRVRRQIVSSQDPRDIGRVYASPSRTLFLSDDAADRIQAWSAQKSLPYIHVGQDRKEHVVHKKVICKKVAFFRKAFMGNFKERDGNMDLPDDEPAISTSFLGYMMACWIAQQSQCI
ncbi:hypothetical protein MBM_04872 [Drepanopeziza brunnea f. sp. 'multigermtubi' MB_m1]|uniref:Uncharacterized protein n=1 Tax=Marssonina brunnea f. sp. multigermtubi (strain MB_m1) TaxID=1072389 RepID=K1WI63_MARBU|nr:uncharacterized protein MBM_04872 [Drepanopeziza brunnea f. sp. 'multigermtubi' MB_m1]EKD17295.1 hypothetical protein MBM_04872 [Drepanopeziza brunnea f. sp. 'multigermtubi' MB_m1]